MASETWRLSRVDVKFKSDGSFEGAYVEHAVVGEDGATRMHGIDVGQGRFAATTMLDEGSINALLFAELGKAVDVLPVKWDAENEEAWQQGKPKTLKMIENLYVSFLRDEWTPFVVAMGLVPLGFVVTPSNVAYEQNAAWLMALRARERKAYESFAGEFDRFVAAIERAGGVMSKAREHPA